MNTTKQRCFPIYHRPPLLEIKTCRYHGDGYLQFLLHVVLTVIQRQVNSIEAGVTSRKSLVCHSHDSKPIVREDIAAKKIL